MKRIILFASLVLLLGSGLIACDDGTGVPPTTTPPVIGGDPPMVPPVVELPKKLGFALPTEISAIPTKPSTTSQTKPGLKSKLLAMVETAMGPETDYSKATTITYVEEPTLERFKSVEYILEELGQTNYADSANLNQGPYKAMIVFDGEQTKQLEPWVVDSAMIIENGKDVNRVQIWAEQTYSGATTTLIKIEFKIYQSAKKKTDGSYQDYGVWTVNAKSDEAENSFFFAASVGIDNDDVVIKIHMKDKVFETKGVMHRSDNHGFGKVSDPGFDSSCTREICNPTPVVSKYAYNASHLAVQVGSGTPQFKDRNAITEMTHRYGMYDSVTGEDVLKTILFGFPVEYIDAAKMRQDAYYGAWQGRHHLWGGNGEPVPVGTNVMRLDRPTPETYTVSAPLVGTFSKRVATPASLDDVKNIPVETWVNSNFQIQYRNAGMAEAGWYECTFDLNGQPTCATPYTAFDTLIVGENDRKYVDISFCCPVYPITDPGISGDSPPVYCMAIECQPVDSPPVDYVSPPADIILPIPIDSLPPPPSLTDYVNYVYLAANAIDKNAAGFYKVHFNPSEAEPTVTPYLPENNDALFINISGPIYIEYTGEKWVQKTVVSFDKEVGTPNFASPDLDKDKPYEMPIGEEFYISSNGANYIVKRTETGYDVRTEIPRTANPVNAATFVPVGTILKSPWEFDGATFEFIGDPTKPHFMDLVYKTVMQGQQGAIVGDVVKETLFGLAAANASSTDQFNWEYSGDGGWEHQQYLKDANGKIVLLSDHIMLAPFDLINDVGLKKTLSLQYDGWMYGLPDLYEALGQNDFAMSFAISDKIINIPAGTLVTDANDTTKIYLIKPLEVSQFLAVVNDPGGLDIGVADAIDLSAVPVFVEHGMGLMPATIGIKYSEGKRVE